VRWRVESGDVGYIRIGAFNQQVDSGFKQALAEITQQVAGDKLKGYVIDLRNSPGGLLDQVVAVADEMLDRGEIVSTRGRTEATTQRFNAKPGDITNGKRIVVLINGGTASGSEIVAGALQDHKRATIIGTRSYGNGSIQTIFPLGPERGALRLTTSRYYTPSGSSIQAKGIVPNIEVLQDEPDDVKQKGKPSGEAMLQGHLPGQGVEQVASQSYVPPDPNNDKALIAAVNLLERDDRAPRGKR
jgi:carboxyl-terminal processing protease